MGKKRRLITTNVKFGRKFSNHPIVRKLYSEEKVVEEKPVDINKEKQKVQTMSNKRNWHKEQELKKQKEEEAKRKAEEEEEIKRVNEAEERRKAKEKQKQTVKTEKKVKPAKSKKTRSTTIKKTKASD